MFVSALVVVSVFFAISRVLAYITALKRVSHMPGLRCALAPMAFPGAIFPTTFWNPGLLWPWEWRKSAYQQFQAHTISCVPFLSGPPSIYTSSVEVAKQIFSPRLEIWKDPHANEILSIWGDNVLSSNHDMHKRHRRVAGSAFNGDTYNMVMQETANLYYEMMECEDWSTSPTVTITAINGYMSKFTLGVISRCGFGIPFPWKGSTKVDGMTFYEALIVVAKSSIVRIATPRWAYKLPIRKLHDVEKAFSTLSVFMDDLIRTRKEEFAHDDVASKTRQDLFTKLVAASGSANEKNKLDDQELIGNVFTFLFAGHETTSHSLSAILAMLALHPEEQDILFAHIIEVLGDDRVPTPAQVDAMYKVLACFQETVRMFPSAALLTRDTTDVITLNLPEEDGVKPVVVEAGVRLVVDMIGMHHNPQLFPDPERFMPSRWYDSCDSDLTFFGMGHRICLGKKFAMVEAVTFLALFFREWKVEPVLADGETLAQWQERTMQMGMRGLAFGVRDVPLKLNKRRNA
ncbi:cytochrome P450 [Gloeophyllum trabeum ATCC 11539]|uniref:Cytochrome P450 n=1 Tax=Gloeophyllum trabeum (strain ATCC 11539 / FP-39264 / Madison 617) TaxID=670483 RepID=S7PS42_GLOTA|nr:cytochrome P450 [Gloeophyllum trabeum ATCC 11539]EPQ50621.1 cytochrome P450 [Gloeophyllum trabeum ATCC 11539]